MNYDQEAAIRSLMDRMSHLRGCIFNSILYKSENKVEWANNLQLMFLMRQSLSCAACGGLAINPHTVIDHECHFICGDCRQNLQLKPNCNNCRKAFENQAQGKESFVEPNQFLTFQVECFAHLCTVLSNMDEVAKWKSLQVQKTTFRQLLSEGYIKARNSNPNLGEENLYRKKAKDKQHSCRCKAPGTLTCRGQRCLCYSEGRGCFNCKCVGCKNPKGASSSDSSSSTM